MSPGTMRRHATDRIDLSGNGTYVVLDGVRIESDELIAPDLLTEASIDKLHDSFVRARPYPHVIVDGLFSQRLLECIDAEFDAVRSADWERYDNRNEHKLGTKPRARLGPAARLYFDTIHSGRFVDFLARVSGVDGLV